MPRAPSPALSSSATETEEDDDFQDAGDGGSYAASAASSVSVTRDDKQDEDEDDDSEDGQNPNRSSNKASPSSTKAMSKRQAKKALKQQRATAASSTSQGSANSRLPPKQQQQQQQYKPSKTNGHGSATAANSSKQPSQPPQLVPTPATFYSSTSPRSALKSHSNKQHDSDSGSEHEANEQEADTDAAMAEAGRRTPTLNSPTLDPDEDAMSASSAYDDEQSVPDAAQPLSNRHSNNSATDSSNNAESGERPFSLSSQPETPSSTTFTSLPASPLKTSPSLASAVWRNSLNMSDRIQSGMVNISLDEGPRTPTRTATAAVVNGTSSPSSSSKRDSTTAGARRHSRADSVDSLQASDPSSSSGQGERYGFLSKRLESQQNEIGGNAHAKRQSVQATDHIRESFARVQRSEATRDDGIDWAFWGRVMSNYEEVASTEPRELSRAIQRGIPEALRGMTWQLMAASKDLVLEEMYGELLKQPSVHEKSIARDLNRTFPKHEYFMDASGAGQEHLFNVVKAYSIYDEEVGYTQGLQFIVGPLLLNMPDEEAFCVLVRLMKSYDLRSHYTPNMPGLQLRLFQFDRLLEELLPGVFMHLLRQGCKSSMYASQWFLTLFGYRFPMELVSSVFDLVFAEGVEAIFRFAIAIMRKNETRICSLEFEELIDYLKNGLFESYAPDDDDESHEPKYKAADFVREALQVRITPLMLDQFAEEWETLTRQQSAHAMEIEALRKANMQLSMQVRQLEASLAQINEEHCDLVKQVVLAKLEREELEEQLVKTKLAYASLSQEVASGASRSVIQAKLDAARRAEEDELIMHGSRRGSSHTSGSFGSS
ncbi:hypothetical protein ACM66B_004688 [Microbotryomycetes sp. NB124-2]